MKSYKVPGLANPVYMPVDVPVTIDLVPASRGNIRSNQKRSASQVTKYTQSREVEIRKFTKVLDGSTVVCACGIFRSGERSDMCRLAVDLNPGNPFLPVASHLHALVSRPRLFAEGVGHVLLVSGKTKVLASVVKGIAVGMVNDVASPGIEDDTVQKSETAINVVGSAICGADVPADAPDGPCVDAVNERESTIRKRDRVRTIAVVDEGARSRIARSTLSRLDVLLPSAMRARGGKMDALHGVTPNQSFCEAALRRVAALPGLLRASIIPDSRVVMGISSQLRGVHA